MSTASRTGEAVERENDSAQVNRERANDGSFHEVTVYARVNGYASSESSRVTSCCSEWINLMDHVHIIFEVPLERARPMRDDTVAERLLQAERGEQQTRSPEAQAPQDWSTRATRRSSPRATSASRRCSMRRTTSRTS